MSSEQETPQPLWVAGSVLCHPQGKEVFPPIQMEPPAFQFVPAAPFFLLLHSFSWVVLTQTIGGDPFPLMLAFRYILNHMYYGCLAQKSNSALHLG